MLGAESFFAPGPLHRWLVSDLVTTNKDYQSWPAALHAVVWMFMAIPTITIHKKVGKSLKHVVLCAFLPFCTSLFKSCTGEVLSKSPGICFFSEKTPRKHRQRFPAVVFQEGQKPACRKSQHRVLSSLRLTAVRPINGSPAPFLDFTGLIQATK